ncbi:MAG TPA: hypothetical protein VHH12_06315, partial [Mycobacterium sp.]|nr:hypothetical protein [Mycobacterium sp.]
NLVLWVGADQPFWGKQVKRLKVGSSLRFSRVTHDSLRDELRSILTPEYAARARAVSAQLTRPAVSVATTADLLENAAHTRVRRSLIR